MDGRITNDNTSRCVTQWCGTLTIREANLPALAAEPSMLMTIAFVLIVLWLLGLVSAYTMGGLIHILLVVAIIVFLVQFIQGRRRA